MDSEKTYDEIIITKKMIKNGIKAKLVTFAVDPNMELGTVCRIGDSWFYFGGLTAEEMNPEQYLKAIPLDTVVNDIFDVLDEFKDDEDTKDEYDYYAHVLFYRNDM